MSPELSHRIEQNRQFQELATKFNPSVSLEDANLLLTHKGYIANVEGWSHPENVVVGETLYVPDPQGNKVIFEEKYRKTSLHPNTLVPIPYENRPIELGKIDKEIKQWSDHSLIYARFKQLIPRDKIQAYFPPRQIFNKIISDCSEFGDRLRLDLENLYQLLSLKQEDTVLGFTGALSLGNFINLHDIDLVFYGTTLQNQKTARSIRNLVRENSNSKRRIYEGHTGWQIRFYNDYNHLMCCFFGYINPSDIPFSNFNLEVVAKDTVIMASVSDDIHNVYTPSILKLHDVYIVREGKNRSWRRSSELLDDNSLLVIYHTASRGHFWKGDRVLAHGEVVRISQADIAYQALLVTEREGAFNLDAPEWDDSPWKGYFNKEISWAGGEVTIYEHK